MIAASGGHNAQPEILCHRDKAGAIREQQNQQCAECQADRLNRDPGEAKLENSRDAAQRQTFQQRVSGRSHRGPFLLEDSNQRADKSADGPDPQLGDYRERRMRSCINRCHVHAAEATAKRRRRPVLLTVPSSVILSPSGGKALKTLLIQYRIRSSHQLRHLHYLFLFQFTLD